MWGVEGCEGKEGECTHPGGPIEAVAFGPGGVAQLIADQAEAQRRADAAAAKAGHKRAKCRSACRQLLV